MRKNDSCSNFCKAGLFRCTISLLLFLSLGAAVIAQEVSGHKTTLTITALASRDRVRFTAPSSVVQVRLEVYSSAGKKVFDNEVRGGNVVDWRLEDGQGERIADDTYLCAVTVKSLAGKFTQRIALVTVKKDLASVNAIDISQMTAQQTDAVGPLEEDASMVVLNEGERQTPTVIAHNGDDGLITRGRGALSFRLGDFYSGKDTEQMRLTPDGNLGIGITNPQVRLDVDGLIRANEGIVFPDGSIQYSASRKTFGAASLRPGQSRKKDAQGKGFEMATPDTGGTGTTGKIAKWSDGPNGILADSNITETSGAIGINGAPNTSFRLDVNGSVLFRGSNPGFNLVGLRPAGNTWAFQTVDSDGRFRLFGQDNVNPGVERFSISLSTGAVGMGTSTPRGGLEVSRNWDGQFGALAVSGDKPTIRFSGGAISGNQQWIIHEGSGPAGALQFYNGGTTGVFASAAISILPSGNVGIGTSTPTYKLEVRNSAPGGYGAFVNGGDNANGDGGRGVEAFGGNGGSHSGGNGVHGVGGDGYEGGIGVVAVGGAASGPSDGGPGIQVFNGNGLHTGDAGFFFGNVLVFGDLMVTHNKDFKIDHPLDPENKYLLHAAIESSEVLNLYSGNVVTDSNAEAIVTLPEWFEALNNDLRYQLTVIGAFAQAIISSEVKDHHFTIKTNEPGVRVSWLVTGVRSDAAMLKKPFKVEQDKPEYERGSYLTPEAFGQPEERGIMWARYPKLMQEMKERREKAQRK